MIPFAEENRAKIRVVAERIEGSCRGLDDVLQEVFGIEDLTMEQVDTELLRELDDMTMECQVCGWWCETGDMDEDQVCSDCR